MLQNKLGILIADNMTPEEFTYKIEEVRLKHNIGYVDAIVHYCEEVDIDVESIASIVDETLKGKIELEASKVNCLPKVNSLPF